MRTVTELMAALGRYLLTAYRGESAQYRFARAITQNMKRPREVLLAEQQSALSRIVDHAYNNSRYYRRRFGEAGFRPGDIRRPSDLRMLPELTKTDLIENMDEVLCVPKEGLPTAGGSGTSGIRVTIYRDQFCLACRRGIDLAIPRYYGWRYGQWRGWLWGATQDLVEPSSRKGRLIRYFGDRQYFLDVSRLGDESYRKFVRDTKRYRPTFVTGYPSIAYDLAERIEAGEVDPMRIPVISLTAEVAYEFQKQKIKAVLADEVYERYGAREYGTVAFECSQHKGLHILTESVFIEADERRTETVRHCLLVTDLLNFAMPLIRYHSGDFAELDYTPCPCGLPTPRVRSIQGRETDIIWRSDGSGIAGAHLVNVLSLAKVDARIQIVQEAIDRIVVRLAAPTGAFTVELDELVKILKEQVGPDVNCEIEHVPEIERAPSGKYRYVISHVNRPDTKRQ